jgi:AraC-like DNA-binding protein
MQAPTIESLVAYEVEGEHPHIAMPHPEFDLVVRFGPATKHGVDAHAFGARERAHRKVPRGVHRTVSARLRLGATAAVLGAPASFIAGHIVPIDDLWGATAARRFFDQLAAAPDAPTALAVVERAITERVARAMSRTSAARLALVAAAKLEHASVTTVAGELSVSERHLRRVFRETTGLPPKTFAKIARFRRALRAARKDEDTSRWAAIAAEAGYYDQAHLIWEFRELTDKTPGALLRELRTTRIMG